MSSILVILAIGLLSLFPGQPLVSAGPMPVSGDIEGVALPTVQEPEDPSRILSLLNGLIDRVQESSPILAAILKFLSVLVYLVLNIKAWGPPALVALVVVIGLLIWQGRRHKKPAPSALEPEEEAEL